MRILFLGAIGEGQTSRMRMRALQRLGHEVIGYDTERPWAEASWLARQAQRRLSRGRVVDRINRDVLALASEARPQLVWAEKQEYLRPETLDALGAGGARRACFTPDPYFWLSWRRTPLMEAAIGRFDVLVYCKAYERADYEALGKPLLYMPLGYCDEAHRPLASDDPRWACGVGFVGGWEPRREALLRSLGATVDDLQIRGGYWDFLRDGRWSLRRQVILARLAGGEPFRIARDPRLARAWRGGEVYGDDFARALSGARIGLGFLRRICPDQHTTRSFEIPACGSLLLADRTEDHQAFFEEGREAEFFGSPEEMIDKARFYLANEPARARIAAAGRARCVRGGYAYVERLAPIMAFLTGAAPRPSTRRAAAPSLAVAG